MNVADFLLADGHPDDIVATDDVGHHTYADLRSSAGIIAAELLEQELASGARVALLGSNSFFWVAAYLAVMKLRLVVVPFSDRATLADVRRNLGVAGCSAVVGDRRTIKRYAGAFEGLPVITDETVAAPTRSPVWPDIDTDIDADAALMFTSGTTNVPKAVRITHGNIAANTTSIATYLELRRTDRVLVILPFHYCYGASLLHTHLRVGARVVLCNSFAYPETAITMLDEQGCTVLAGVPSSFQLLLRTTTYARRRLPSLRIVQQAGGKLPPVLIEELAAAQPDASVFVMYGQTEATARLSYLPPDRLGEKAGSIGKGIPGVELTVRGEDMAPVAPGTRGEIYAVGANISPGYFADPEGSRAKFTPHGLRTGDLAVVDEDGYIFVVDRRDDFIKSWGHRVSSQEIEAVALQMGDLVSAAAVGIPDDQAGEAVVLFFTARPGSAVAEVDVVAHCRNGLPKHMVPRFVHLLDGIPLNANGKVSKNRLREIAGSARTALPLNSPTT